MRFSVIIPVFNEIDSLRPLLTELQDVMGKMEGPSEIVFVDDGSSDGSAALLEEFERDYDNVRCLYFRRNFGQTAALLAGFEEAQGEWVVTMDADLQNDPKDMPAMLEKAESGFDIVSGWRKNRQDKFLRCFLSRIANRFISYTLKTPLHDFGCTLKVYRRDLLKDLKLYGEMHRFLPAVAGWSGGAITEMVVNHRKRQYGQSKYGFERIRPVILDLIAVKFLNQYIHKPIRVFGRLSVWLLGAGLLVGTKVAVDGIWYQRDLTFNSYLVVSSFLLLMSLQMLALGLVCEVGIRTYYESQDKKTFRLRSPS